MKNKLDVEFHMLNCVTKKKWIDVGNIDLTSVLQVMKNFSPYRSDEFPQGGERIMYAPSKSQSRY